MKPSKRTSVKISRPSEGVRVSILDQKNYMPVVPYIQSLKK